MDQSELLKKISSTLNLLFNSNNSKDNWDAQKFLTDFQSDLNSYSYIPLITGSKDPKVVYFGLQILERTIVYNWQNLSKEEKIFFQNLVIDLLFKYTSTQNAIKENSLNIKKLNVVLVKIIIQDEESIFIFLKDLILSAKISEQICENNLNIILMFFDELCSTSNYQVSTIFQRYNNISNNILKEMEFLCYFIFMQFDILYNQKQSLIIASLDVFEKLITIAPSNYIIEEFFLESFMYLSTKINMRNFVMRCLIEIANTHNILTTLLLSRLIKFFIIQLQEIIPISKDLICLYNQMEQNFKEFIKNGAIFFLSFFKNSFSFFRNNILFNGFFTIINQFMIKISCLPELEIFKICIDWWKIFILKVQNNEFSSIDFSKYAPFIDLKKVVIGRMAKPEEVLIVEDDNGVITRETTKNTEAISIYNKEKAILIYLTKLDEQFVRQILLEKLNFQFNKNLWNRATLNSLCWSIGSISEIFNLEYEKHFIVAVVKDLLCLAEMRKGKDNKAVIASNIMYIVGQYPRFLRNHWKFLKTVIYKLFEFMHETHPGIQDMASDTFLKITKTCSDSIYVLQDGEPYPFLDEILNSIYKITNSLDFHQISQFYESIAVVIKNINNLEISAFYVSKIFEIINNIWFVFLKKKIFHENFESFGELLSLIKLNKKIATVLDDKYFSYIKILYSELSFLYSWLCTKIFNLLNSSNVNSNNSKNLNVLKSIRNEILSLISYYVKIYFKSKYYEEPSPKFNEIIEPILNNYKMSLYFCTGELELIQFCNNFLNECEFFIEIQTIVLVFEKIFKPTLDLIKIDFQSYPDLRKAFFFLIKSISHKYFPFLFKLSLETKKAEENFEIIIQSIIWGMKHLDLMISKLSLKILLVVLEKVNLLNIGNFFYSKYILQLLVDLIALMIDGLHTPILKLQCRLFFHLIKESKIFVDKNYLKNYIQSVFNVAFPDIFNKIRDKKELNFLDHEYYHETEEEFKKFIKVKNVIWENESSSEDKI